jgi:hypothetical protein
LKRTKIYFLFLKKYCNRSEDVLFFFSIVAEHNARLRLGELVPTSPNADTANFLSFDVYDIDISKIMNDSSLNFVLLQMTSKSIIVVENLHRFLMEKLIAMSLFVDVHIHFSLCDFLAFKTLANSYLELKDHKLFSQVARPRSVSWWLRIETRQAGL